MNELLKQGIAVLDGAMGTMIQKYGLTETDFHTKQISGDTGEIPQELIDCGKDDDIPKALEELRCNSRELMDNRSQYIQCQ